MQITYRTRTVNIHFDSNAWAWMASGDINQKLNAETDDGAIIEAKALIDSIENASLMNPQLSAFVETL